MFAPDAVGMHLADLGAEVIKVEQPGIGDPARLLGKPYRGESPATRRWNRGKHSITLDLSHPDGVDVFRDLVAVSDAVVEGMRAGALARRGVGYHDLLAVNPRLVFASVSGWGSDGPYAHLGSHGLAFDAFAGLAPPRLVDGRPARPLGHVWTGLEAGPLYAALAIVAAILRARSTDMPSSIEVSEADAAAVWNGWRIAYDAAVARYGEAPDDPDQRELVNALEVAAEGAGRPGDHDLTATDVRYQYYKASDGHILLMATEQKFWAQPVPGHRPARPAGPLAGLGVRGPRLRQRRATRRALRNLRSPLPGRMDRAVHRAQHRGRTRVSARRDPRRRTFRRPGPVARPGRRRHRPPRVTRAGGRRPRAPGPARPAAGADGPRILRHVLGYDQERIDALTGSGEVS